MGVGREDPGLFGEPAPQVRHTGLATISSSVSVICHWEF
jgi:hypothetical protein